MLMEKGGEGEGSTELHYLWPGLIAYVQENRERYVTIVFAGSLFTERGH